MGAPSVLLLVVFRGGDGGVADLRDGGDQNNLSKKTPLLKTFSGNFLGLFGGGTAPRRFTLRAH